MDLSFVNNRLAHDATQPPWTTGQGSPAARTDESFADHLQAEPPPTGSASDTHALPSIENASADAPPHDDDEQNSPPAADDPVEPTAEAAAVAVPGEPSTRQVAQPDADPTARHDADEGVVAPDQTKQPPDPSERASAAAGARTTGTNDADPTGPDPAGHCTVQQNPVTQSVEVPVTSQAAQTQTPAQPQPTADLAVVTEAATDPALAAENSTTTSATTAAPEKPSGKSKTDKSPSAVRIPGAQQRNAAAPSDLAVLLDWATAVEVGVNLANRVADTASTEPATPEPGADRASTTGTQEVDVRTQTSQRAHTLAERLPEQLLVRGSTDSSATHELTQADQQRLIQRVARAMEAASQRGGPLRLRLRPPELGSLRLEVSLHDGNLSAKIETETQATKTLLLDQLPQLRDRLADQGFHVAQFDVDVSEQHSGDASFEPPNADDSWPAPPARRRTTESTESPVERAPHQRVYAQPGKLNVVI